MRSIRNTSRKKRTQEHKNKLKTLEGKSKLYEEKRLTDLKCPAEGLWAFNNGD